LFRSKIEYARDDDKGWLPQSVRSESLELKTGTTVSFTNVVANPNVTDESFRITFPKGTIVDDHIQKIQYTVGVTPADEAKQVQDYLQRYDLQKYLAETARDQVFPSHGGLGRVLILANIAVLIGLVLLWMIRRARRTRPPAAANI
jgi:hypothetical protein